MADEPLLWRRMACLYTCPMKQHCTQSITMSFAQSCLSSLACSDDTHPLCRHQAQRLDARQQSQPYNGTMLAEAVQCRC